MADEKTQAFEETKWWIDRGPVKEREKPAAAPVKGIIEKWAYDLLKNYNQDQAAKNLVDINSKILNGLAVGPGEWGYYSLEIGVYPAEKLTKIKSGLPLPNGARGVASSSPMRSKPSFLSAATISAGRRSAAIGSSSNASASFAGSRTKVLLATQRDSA